MSKDIDDLKELILQRFDSLEKNIVLQFQNCKTDCESKIISTNKDISIHEEKHKELSKKLWALLMLILGAITSTVLGIFFKRN